MWSLDGYVIEQEPEEEIKESKSLSPFDILNAINYTKEDIDPDLLEKSYLPYLINRGLSNSQDTVQLANIMNQHWDLPKGMQFDFLRSTVRKRKRFDKWAKKVSNEKIALICAFYKYSVKAALRVSHLVSDEDLVAMQRILDSRQSHARSHQDRPPELLSGGNHSDGS